MAVKVSEFPATFLDSIEDVSKRVVVVSDTHVPDKVESLPPGFIAEMRILQPDLILHAGDICSPVVIDELSKVAPVVAARGNRDLLFSRKLPLVARVELQGVKLAVMHGHGGVVRYLRDKVEYTFQGYDLERYCKVGMAAAPDADVIVFGHSHMPELVRFADILYFNPGSLIGSKGYDPLYGVLAINSKGEVFGQHIVLRGAKREGRHWVNGTGKKPNLFDD